MGGPAQAPPRPGGPRGILGASSPPTPADPDVQRWRNERGVNFCPQGQIRPRPDPALPGEQKQKKQKGQSRGADLEETPPTSRPEKARRGAPRLPGRPWPCGAGQGRERPSTRRAQLTGTDILAAAPIPGGQAGAPVRRGLACSGPPVRGRALSGLPAGSCALPAAADRPTDRRTGLSGPARSAHARPPPLLPGPPWGAALKAREDPGPRRFSVGPTRRGAWRLEFLGLGRQSLTRPALHRLGAGG